MANLIAMLIAQRAKAENDIARKGLCSGSRPNKRLYASDQVHMSDTEGSRHHGYWARPGADD